MPYEKAVPVLKMHRHKNCTYESEARVRPSLNFIVFYSVLAKSPLQTERKKFRRPRQCCPAKRPRQRARGPAQNFGAIRRWRHTGRKAQVSEENAYVSWKESSVKKDK